MADRKRPGRAEQLLELLDIYHRNRRELERREAGYEVLQVPLELRSGLVEVREHADDAETRLREIEAQDGSGGVTAVVRASRLRQAQADADHLRALQEVRQAKVDELERRKARYGPMQAPLKLVNSLAAEREELEKLARRLRRAQVERARLEPEPALVPDEPETLHLWIATPDGARYETDVAADTMVTHLQAAFLDEWRPPENGTMVRYTLRREEAGYPLDPALTLAEADVQERATLYLVSESLFPDSPVGLTVEDAEGNRYVTAVRLDTSIDVLVQAFMEMVRGSGRAMVELLSESEERRRLRQDATLYEEHVGDGAQLRISPALSVDRVECNKKGYQR